MVRAFCLLLVLLSSFGKAGAQGSSDLELQIRPEQIQAGVPQTFTFLLTNRSQHTVRIPKPTLECSDLYDGTIWLRAHFIPAKPASGDSLGRGCFADKWGRAPILERTAAWQELEPGHSVSLHANKAELFYEDKEPGSYEFWADYFPPSIGTEDQRILHGAGISFPVEKLTSPHVTFVKRAR